MGNIGGECSTPAYFSIGTLSDWNFRADIAARSEPQCGDSGQSGHRNGGKQARIQIVRVPLPGTDPVHRGRVRGFDRFKLIGVTSSHAARHPRKRHHRGCPDQTEFHQRAVRNGRPDRTSARPPPPCSRGMDAPSSSAACATSPTVLTSASTGAGDIPTPLLFSQNDIEKVNTELLVFTPATSLRRNCRTQPRTAHAPRQDRHCSEVPDSQRALPQYDPLEEIRDPAWKWRWKSDCPHPNATSLTACGCFCGRARHPVSAPGGTPASCASLPYSSARRENQCLGG